MKLQFFSGDFFNIPEARRAELTAIADRYFCEGMSVEQMLKNARMATSMMSNEEVLFVESVIRQKSLESREYKPIVRGVRVADNFDCSYNDMISRQFCDVGDNPTLYISFLLENPFYGKEDVQAEYQLGMSYEQQKILNICELVSVKMSRNQQFCIACTEMTKPREVKGVDSKILNFRISVKEANTEEVLSAVDFQILRGPEIKRILQLQEYFEFKEAAIYELDEPDYMLTEIPAEVDVDLGFRVKFKFKYDYLFPEIEARVYIVDETKGILLRSVILNAKPFVENGETIYMADCLLFDKQTCAELKKGKYSYCVFIWSDIVHQEYFEVVQSEKELDSLLGGLKYLFGKHKSEKKTTEKDEFDKLLEELDAMSVGKSVDEESQNEGFPEEDSQKLAHEHLALDSLDIYKQKYINELKPDETAEGFTTFKESFDDDIVVYAFFDILKEIDSPENLPMCFFLYDDTGRMLQSCTANCNLIDSAGKKQLYAVAPFLKNNLVNWSKGFYKIEASLWDETLISIRFEICDVDTRGTFDPVAAQPRMGQGSVKQIVNVEDAMQQLDEMIGIPRVKEKIRKMANVTEFAKLRKEAGLPFRSPSLHACFVGPSGTGKTTLAGIIGAIYHEMGLLSKGHVVYEERRTLIGRFYDSEQREVERALRNAQGGVLFIDEAYSLYVEEDPKDPGHKVIEALMTALSDESNRDWMLVLAGYPDDIDKLLNGSNQGLSSRVKDIYYFDELTTDELIDVADLYCRRNQYVMTQEARRALESVISRASAIRPKNFGNARYINEELMNDQVINAMSNRVKGIVGKPSHKQLKTIEKEDIPVLIQTQTSKKLDELNQMIGLDSLKKSISSHLNFVNMLNMRMKHGLYTTMPPLHMIFTGNPGTGKTTVAELMGEIYASLGLISHGEVIKVEKRDLIGIHIGDTEKRMNEVLDRARGNVLFIEEAHQLWSEDSSNDFGRNVVNSLMGVLGNDRIDMIVILAGYGPEMERLISMDRGLRSRFPYIFEFKDYSADELMEIAELTIAKENFVLSSVARAKLMTLLNSAVEQKEDGFGNARYVNRLITTQILHNMSDRLEAMESEPTKEQLMTIEPEDVPSAMGKAGEIEYAEFDEALISSALQRLDSLVGLKNVKQTVHNFVDISRIFKRERKQIFGNHLMKWNFAGNSGTGKSTVAEIMADLLKAMGLIDHPSVVEVKGEELYNVSEFKCDEILKKAMEKSKYGLLFVDSDAPMFRNPNQWTLTGEQLRIKLAALTAEVGGNGAIIIAENKSPRHNMVNSLAENGIYNFDKTLIFEDYSASELFEILSSQLACHSLELSDEAADKMKRYINALCSNRSLSLANARTMKLLAESIVQINMLRVSRDASARKGLVSLEDVESFEWRKPVRKIGF